MHPIFYKTLLAFLRALMTGKRLFVQAMGSLGRFVQIVEKKYQSHLGFYVYKAFFYIKRTYRELLFSKRESKLEFFGRRGTLQFFLSIIVIVIMLPHSKLYSKNYNDIVGKDSLLYNLVGHDNQEVALDAVVQSRDVAVATQQNTWNQGAVSQVSGITGNGVLRTRADFASISVGGTALAKPYIMTGVDIQEFQSDVAPAVTTRKTIVYYTVESGDVLGQIAEAYGIGLQTLLNANNLSANAYISPGDVLTILPVDGVVHTVKSGQTVSQIARLYQADADDVAKFNNIKNGTIQIGQKLIIPGGIAVESQVRQYAYQAPANQSTPTQVRTPQTQAPTTVYRVPAGFRQVNYNPEVIEDTVIDPNAPSPSAAAGKASYIWPSGATTITQYFGWQHNGLDIAGAVGINIYATRAGTVTVSQCGWNWGYGCYVQIDHGNGIETVYGHASKLYVSAGEHVAQGQTIAAIGSTGNSTGPHVHFELRLNGVRQNPLSYVTR